MPVTGIESILCQNCTHFEPLLFKSSPVVVDGENFVTYYRLLGPTSYLWGGEPLSMAVLWNEVLKSFEKCAIDPLFVFSAGTERRGQQLVYQLNGMKKRLICLERLARFEANQLIPEFSPILSQYLIVDLLDAINVSHLRSPYGMQPSCASLANRMQCPLMASAVEYLLLGAELRDRNYSGFAFIPFQCTRLIPIAVNDMIGKPCSDPGARQSFALSVHKFLPEESSIHNVCSFYRPLVFLLLGTDSLPRIRIPKSLNNRMNIAMGTDYKSRRWDTILFWLNQFQPASLKPIDQIANCYSTEEKDLMLLNLADSVLHYIPNPNIGKRLASFLLESPLTKEPPLKTEGVDSVPRCISDIQPDNNWKAVIHAVLRDGPIPSGVDQLMTIDFTAGWPDNLVRAFHQSQILDYIFVALYTQGGVILPSLIENLKTLSTLWDTCLTLRLLHYRILVGLESQLGRKDKLIGLCPDVIEYTRYGSDLVRYHIPVQPLLIATDVDSTDELLTRNLGLSLVDYESDLKSMSGLLFSLAIWQHWKIAGDSNPLPVDRSPVILAILLCTVANDINFCSLDEELVKYYDEISSFAESRLNSTSGRPQTILPLSFRIDCVHEFNGIQLVYSCLRSLTTLIDQLVLENKRSKCLFFAPPWKLFPSGRLVHWLAACLENQEPTVRRHHAVRFWLPRLYRNRTQGPNDITTLKRMVALFDKSLYTLSRIVQQQLLILNTPHNKFYVVLGDFASFKPVEVKSFPTSGNASSVNSHLPPVDSACDRNFQAAPSVNSGAKPKDNFLNLLKPTHSTSPSHQNKNMFVKNVSPNTVEHSAHLSQHNLSVPTDLTTYSSKSTSNNNSRANRAQLSYGDRLRERLKQTETH
ncbi:hypothetical protein PHET_08079 [Paragonimus heterotremus]|uniref:Asteroid domain-containing protein n=1 Tax=Paragonimus heterotremus TaxID=100268 RepID=A0A8J4TF39_9TREM|nr:hypothetical protein PHET_08079 [Paragonimus heterotremus]